MTTPFATLEGHDVAAAHLHVPGRGPWFVDVDMVDAPELAGRVTLRLGTLDLVGTVDARYTGTQGLQRRLRVVAGGGGWGTLLRPKAYHNDAQIRASQVAGDAAREAGEVLGDFAPAAERIGIDYVRQAGPASRALEDVIGDMPWWVGYDGITRVGARASSAAADGTYEVLEHDTRGRVVHLTADDLMAVGIGSVLSQRLDAPQTVRELDVVVTPESVRIAAWCGGEDGSRGRLATALRGVIERATDGRLHGHYRYRVVQMSADRVELQAVRRRAGLPDVLPVSMWPGVAGAHAQLSPGAEVLVVFVEGLRTEPVIVAFAGKDGPGFVPVRLDLSSSTPAPAAARLGDSVQVTIPISTVLVASPGPPGYAPNPVPITVTGTITSGSTKVGIG